MDWFSYVAGVVSVFAFVGLAIFAVALVVSIKKVRAGEASKKK